MTDPAPPTTDLKDTLEAMRASVAAQGERTGLAGAIQDAILKFLEMFLAMLVEFRAGRLAALAPVAEDARRGSGSCVARGDRGEENTLTPVGPLCGPTPRCAGEGEEFARAAWRSCPAFVRPRHGGLRPPYAASWPHGGETRKLRSRPAVALAARCIGATAECARHAPGFSAPAAAMPGGTGPHRCGKAGGGAASLHVHFVAIS